MIKGLNITITIQREIDGPDDDVGGSVKVKTTIATGVLARISQVSAREVELIQGYDTRTSKKAVVYPVYTDVREGDYVIPESGSLIGINYRVIGKLVDSILPSDPRAHLELMLVEIPPKVHRS